MQGLHSLLAFSETAKRGSFAAASRELGTTPSTLAKSVKRLEGSLGLRLFHRTTRQVSLTPDGERLFARCQRVLAELEALQTDASGVSAQPSGLLRIDMPIVLGRRIVLPMLAELVRRHPALELDVRLSDAYVDLVKDGIDVAVRVGTLSDSTLVARRFASHDLVLAAAPAYLAQRGTPGKVEDLAAHDAILFRMPTSGRERPWELSVGGRTVTLHPAARFRFNDGEAMVQAARMELGLVQVPDYMVSDAIAEGALVELLPQLRPPTVPIHAVIPANRMVPARVRAFLDALQELPMAEAGAPSRRSRNDSSAGRKRR
jgi:DNA-binding transcriptional LysR family regulator